MVKRIGILLASVCVAVVAQGTVFEVNGTFAGAADGTLPEGWKFHGYPGYKPDPRFETVAGPVAGKNALRIYEIHGESGMALLASPRIYAAVGDVIFVSLMAKGTGKPAVSLFRTTASNRWNQVSSGVPLKVTPEWKQYEAELPVTDGLTGPTRWVEIALGAKTGSDVCFTDVVVKRLRVRRPDTGEAERFETLVLEDYENPDEKRPGDPQSVEGEFAPGIPQRVKQGRYRVPTPVSIDLAKAFVFPKGEDEFFQSVVRVYDFGGGQIARTVKGARGLFSAAFRQNAATGGYTCIFRENGKMLGQLDLPADALPADFSLSFDSDGGFTFAATTLAGSARRAFSGDTSVFGEDPAKPFTATLVLAPGVDGTPAEMTIDEHLAAYARPVAVKPLPYPCEPEPAFDPVKAGWPLVFKDDFDGQKLDDKEWFIPPWRRKTAEMAHLDGKGRLVVEAAPDPENTGLLKSTAVWSKRAFLYGYFESRLKFTKLPGWWSAYWLYGMSNNNPFLDGLEIDIFEDFTTRSGGKEISHNMHVIHPAPQSALKSWSSHSELPGAIDDYYVIGCKWTPFEISLYINGRLMRSVGRTRGRDTVTFDAFDTAACAVPLHIIFSGQAAGSTKGQIDFSKYPYPECFEVDSIKVYAYPDADTGPHVTWTCDTGAAVARIGDELRFSAEAKPNKANVTAVYLFDNGYPVAFKTEPPYAFRVPFTKAHYDTTRYMTPGISGVKPPFDGYTHAFIVFARDEKGRISKTEPILRIPDSVYARAPWDAKHRAFLRSGDAFNFDYEAPEAGPYSVGARYVASDDLPFDNKLVLMVDGIQRDVIDLPYNQQPPKAISRTVALTAGKHRITFVPIGLYNVYGIEVGKEK